MKKMTLTGLLLGLGVALALPANAGEVNTKKLDLKNPAVKKALKRIEEQKKVHEAFEKRRAKAKKARRTHYKDLGYYDGKTVHTTTLVKVVDGLAMVSDSIAPAKNKEVKKLNLPKNFKPMFPHFFPKVEQDPTDTNIERATYNGKRYRMVPFSKDLAQKQIQGGFNKLVGKRVDVTYRRRKRNATLEIVEIKLSKK